MGHKSTKWVILTIAYAGMIAFFSLLPGKVVENSFLKDIVTDLAHIPAYLILTYFLVKLFLRLKWRINFYAAAFIVSVAYGGFIEYCQSFVPGRDMSLKDLASNTLGTLITIFIFRKRIYKLCPLRQRKD